MLEDLRGKSEDSITRELNYLKVGYLLLPVLPALPTPKHCFKCQNLFMSRSYCSGRQCIAPVGRRTIPPLPHLCLSGLSRTNYKRGTSCFIRRKFTLEAWLPYLGCLCSVGTDLSKDIVCKVFTPGVSYISDSLSLSLETYSSLCANSDRLPHWLSLSFWLLKDHTRHLRILAWVGSQLRVFPSPSLSQGFTNGVELIPSLNAGLWCYMLSPTPSAVEILTLLRHMTSWQLVVWRRMLWGVGVIIHPTSSSGLWSSVTPPPIAPQRASPLKPQLRYDANTIMWNGGGYRNANSSELCILSEKWEY